MPTTLPYAVAAEMRDRAPKVPNGTDWDSGRCMECDSRYCYDGCGDVPGNVYVVGVGYVTEADGITLAAAGYEVDTITRDGYLRVPQEGSPYPAHVRTDARLHLIGGALPETRMGIEEQVAHTWAAVVTGSNA